MYAIQVDEKQCKFMFDLQSWEQNAAKRIRNGLDCYYNILFC
jgi:hypothetical protein